MSDNDFATLIVSINCVQATAYGAPVHAYRFYTRPVAAKYLQSKGYKVSSQRLKRLATTGEGPDHRTWDGNPFYEQHDLDRWA